MTLKTFLQSPRFQRIVLLVWLVSSALVMFSQQTIDRIVNKTLYDYGLQFNIAWAQPYWTYARMLYATQFVCIVLSVMALASGLLKKDLGVKPTPKRAENRPKSTATQEETNGRAIVISCSSCKRVFSKPLVMLDFGKGKGKLVNVCPYCNAVLGNVEGQNDFGTTVDPGEEVVHKNRPSKQGREP
jgi:uncharacterized Zn-finger protein